MNDQRLRDLLLKYYEKTATTAERQELMAILRDGSLDEAVRKNMLDLFLSRHDFDEILEAGKADELLKQVFISERQAPKSDVSNRQPSLRRFKVLRSFLDSRKYWAAASIVFLALAGGFWLKYPRTPKPEATVVKADSGKLMPGKEKAQLTLWNGTVVDLEKGEAYDEANFKINAEKGELVFTGRASDAGYNLLKTPLGGQYKIVLPDGSNAWLNAGSSLRFPTNFGNSNREVEVTGEVFFDVTHDKKRPFVVSFPQHKPGAMKIVVLGTEFNVSSYQDDPSIQTTLVKGSVAVSRGESKTVLSPGQQAEVRASEAGEIKVKQVDAGAIAAWKDGRFEFAGNNIRDIMRQIARWYAVDVEYDGDFTNKAFQGGISRKETAAEVLKFLELTGEVRFEIKDKKIKVIAI